MTRAELNALHTRWLADVRDSHYDRRFTLNLWFSTVAELQGLNTDTDTMWADAQAIRGIFDSLMELVENVHERGHK